MHVKGLGLDEILIPFTFRVRYCDDSNLIIHSQKYILQIITSDLVQNILYIDTETIMEKRFYDTDFVMPSFVALPLLSSKV